MRLAPTTVGAHLRAWRFSPQQPKRRALEQNPAAVRRWLAETYPAIHAQARREGGVVLWLDELGVWSDQAAGRSLAPVGHTPVVKRTGKRLGVSMLSVIANQGCCGSGCSPGRFAARSSSTSCGGCCAIVLAERST